MTLMKRYGSLWMPESSGIGPMSANFGSGVSWTPLKLGSALKFFIDRGSGMTLGTGTNIDQWADQTSNAQNYNAIAPNTTVPTRVSLGGLVGASFSGTEALIDPELQKYLDGFRASIEARMTTLEREADTGIQIPLRARFSLLSLES